MCFASFVLFVGLGGCVFFCWLVDGLFVCLDGCVFAAFVLFRLFLCYLFACFLLAFCFLLRFVCFVSRSSRLCGCVCLLVCCCSCLCALICLNVVGSLRLFVGLYFVGSVVRSYVSSCVCLFDRYLRFVVSVV